MYTCTQACTHRHTHTGTHTCTHAHTLSQTHSHSHTHTHIHTHNPDKKKKLHWFCTLSLVLRTHARQYVSIKLNVNKGMFTACRRQQFQRPSWRCQTCIRRCTCVVWSISDMPASPPFSWRTFRSVFSTRKMMARWVQSLVKRWDLLSREDDGKTNKVSRLFGWLSVALHPQKL